MKLRPLLFLSLSGLHGTVWASDFYMGANAALITPSTDFKLQDDTTYPEYNIEFAKDYQAPDDSGLGYELVWGYRLSRDIGLEFTYAGETKITGEERPLAESPPDQDLHATESLRMQHTKLAINGVFPVANNLALNLRVGIASWKLRYSQKVLNYPQPDVVNPDPEPESIRTESYRDTASSLFYGLSLAYAFNADFELRAGYELHNVDFGFTNVDVGFDAGILTLGGVVYF